MDAKNFIFTTTFHFASIVPFIRGHSRVSVPTVCLKAYTPFVSRVGFGQHVVVP